jgi:hypothetical protein
VVRSSPGPRYNLRMPESGSSRTPALQGWQRANVIAAANCLREQLARTPEDVRLLAAYEGLLDLLDPSRMLARRQREMAAAAREAMVVKVERRRRDRRSGVDRRTASAPPPRVEQRSGQDRRSGRDRRHR